MAAHRGAYTLEGKRRNTTSVGIVHPSVSGGGVWSVVVQEFEPEIPHRASTGKPQERSFADFTQALCEFYGRDSYDVIARAAAKGGRKRIKLIARSASGHGKAIDLKNASRVDDTGCHRRGKRGKSHARRAKNILGRAASVPVSGKSNRGFGNSANKRGGRVDVAGATIITEAHVRHQEAEEPSPIEIVNVGYLSQLIGAEGDVLEIDSASGGTKRHWLNYQNGIGECAAAKVDGEAKLKRVGPDVFSTFELNAIRLNYPRLIDPQICGYDNFCIGGLGAGKYGCGIERRTRRRWYIYRRGKVRGVRRGQQVLRVVMQRSLAARCRTRSVRHDDAGRATATDDGCCEVLVDGASGRRRKVARNVAAADPHSAVFIVRVMRLYEKRRRVVHVHQVAQYGIPASLDRAHGVGRHGEDVACQDFHRGRRGFTRHRRRGG